MGLKTRSRCYFTVVLLLATLPVKSSFALPGDLPKATAAARESSSSETALLQDRVDLSIVGRPLRFALSAVSAKCRVDLMTSPAVGEQRVALFFNREPLARLMTRLPQLLSHSPGRPEGYHWEKLPRKPSERPAYLLWRDQRSRDQEQAELNYPRILAARSLRIFRDAIAHPEAPEDPAKLPFNATWLVDQDTQPYRAAIGGLSDPQIDALMAGQSVPLDPAGFATPITAYREQWYQSVTRQIAQAAAAGQKNPFPDGIPGPPYATPSIAVRTLDQDGFPQAMDTSFSIHLQGMSLRPVGDSAIYLSPLDDNVPPFVGPPDTYNKGYDLTPLLGANGVTGMQRGDMGFTLAALANITGIIVYQEYFLKTDDAGQWPAGLQRLKGTLPELINAICDAWGYTAVYRDGAYFFWSRHWALDRAADIAEPLLDRWGRRLKIHGFLSLGDRLEMASTLNWRQTALTLNVAIPEAKADSRESYSALRLVGLLEEPQLAEAEKPEGLELALLLPWQQSEVLQVLCPMLGTASSQDLNTARLHVTIDSISPPGTPHRTRVQFDISSGDHSLFGTIMSLRDAPLPAQPAQPQ